MMKKYLVTILLLLALLGTPIIVIASDISDADYFGIIQIANNSTATTNVSTTCNISTQNLIDGNYLNSSANNCVIRTSSGADVPFMPSVNATYPWAIWIPGIGADSYQNDILYTANSTGGEIRYFPGIDGMTTADNTTLELADNFTVEQRGWIDTDFAADKYLVNKGSAFRTYISGTENITSTIDGFEALTSYTEVDANNKLTVNMFSAVGEDVDNDEDVYLYTDFGANYFNALDVDFEILIASTSIAGGVGGIGITNTIGSGQDFAADEPWAGTSKGTPSRIYLYRGIAASDFYNCLDDTIYYCTLLRAAANDVVDLLIYTDPARTTLVDTLTLAGYGGATRWQYAYGFVNRNQAIGGDDWDGWVRNFHLNGGVDSEVTAAGVSSGEHTVTTTLFPNLISNGSYETGDPPTGWAAAPGSIGQSTTEVYIGTYSANLTNTLGNQAQLQQDIVNYLACRGNTITQGGWVWADVANRVSLRLVDSDGSINSAFHSGGGSWEWLTVSRAIGVGVTYVRPRLQLLGASVDTAYMDGAILIIETSVADYGNFVISIDGSETGAWADLGTTVPDNTDTWAFLTNNVMPYMESHHIWIAGILQQDILWEYDTIFEDLSGNNHDATPTFRTASSDPDVSAALVSFLPIAEAKAPDYVLGEAPDFIDPGITGNVTGAFTTTPGAGTFPLSGVIIAIANATETPSQLPLLIIAVFCILAGSLTASALMRQYGSGTIFVKILIIVAFLGIFIAIGNFAIDFWMLVVFLIIGIALGMASKQVGWS